MNFSCVVYPVSNNFFICLHMSFLIKEQITSYLCNSNINVINFDILKNTSPLHLLFISFFFFVSYLEIKLKYHKYYLY